MSKNPHQSLKRIERLVAKGKELLKTRKPSRTEFLAPDFVHRVPATVDETLATQWHARTKSTLKKYFGDDDQDFYGQISHVSIDPSEYERAKHILAILQAAEEEIRADSEDYVELNPNNPPRSSHTNQAQDDVRFDRLSNLLPGQFEEIRFKLGVQPGLLSGSQSEKSVQVIRICQQKTKIPRLDQLLDTFFVSKNTRGDDSGPASAKNQFNIPDGHLAAKLSGAFFVISTSWSVKQLRTSNISLSQKDEDFTFDVSIKVLRTKDANKSLEDFRHSCVECYGSPPTPISFRGRMGLFKGLRQEAGDGTTDEMVLVPLSNEHLLIEYYYVNYGEHFRESLIDLIKTVVFPQ